MSEQQTENSSDEQIPAVVKKQTGGKRCKVVLFIIFIIALACIALFAYGYFRLHANHRAVSEHITELNQQINDLTHEISTIKSDVQNVNTTAQKSKELSEQQEKLMNEWRAAEKGDLNKWHLVEAQHLVKMANNQLKVSNNVNLATALLQQADATLQNVQNATNIRDAIAADLVKLQALPTVDTDGLFARLNALDRAINNLVLTNYPLNDQKTKDTTANTETNEQLSWWRRGLNNAWQALSKTVVVRDMRNSALPLGLPEEKTFLYQNLHAQFSNAMWAVLHNDNNVYNESLSRITEWLTQYFNMDDPGTKNMLQNITELKKINLAPISVDLSDTIALFDHSNQPVR